MDALANRLTLWAMLVAWLMVGWWTWSHISWVAGSCFLAAGLCAALWNLLFLPVARGRSPDDLWRAVIFINYHDAPFGHFLSIYLPIVSKVSLVAAVALLVFPNAA